MYVIKLKHVLKKCEKENLANNNVIIGYIWL